MKKKSKTSDAECPMCAHGLSPMDVMIGIRTGDKVCGDVLLDPGSLCDECRASLKAWYHMEGEPLT